MKVRQHTLQIFEFILGQDEKKKFFNYFKRNEPLLRHYTIVLSGDMDFSDIEEFLNEREICYLFNRRDCDFNSRNRVEISLDEVEDTVPEEREKKNIKIREVYEKPIRSGVAIQSDRDIAIFSQINDGAEVETSGNLEIFGTVNGKVICNGSYMIIRDIGESGTVIFNGVILEKKKFQTKQAKLLKLDFNRKLIVEEL